MRLYPVWIALAVTACAELEIATRSQPIIGGEQTSPDEFPSIAAVEYAPGDWTCTGTLVHERWVLTAAHCVVGETPATLQVRFGDTDINDTTGGVVVGLAAVHWHPDFDDERWDDDIALLELAAPVTDREPAPIRREPLPPGTTVTQVGYGDADDHGNGDGILRKLVSASVACAEAGDPEISDEHVLCFEAGDGTATCYGDSGGPNYVDGEVVGVNSGNTEDLCDDGWDLQTSVPGELAFLDQYLPGDGGEDDGDGEGDDGGGDDDGGGCASTRGHGPALVALGLAGLLRRRRR